MTAIVVLSRSLSVADIWSESDRAACMATVEVVRTLSELGARMATGSFHALAGEDAAEVRERILEIAGVNAETRSVNVEDLYASIFESSREVLILLDLEGRIILTNKTFRVMIGREASELNGAILSDLVEEDSREIASSLVAADPVRNPSAQVLELVGMDGQIIDLEVIPHLLGHNGGIHGIQLLGRDISEQRRHDADLVLANKKLVLLGSMTRHDILNKAMILSGYLEMATAEDITPGGRDALESAQRVLESVVRIMEATRNYQKLGSSDSTWINIDREVRAYTKGRSIPGVDLICTTGDLEVLVDPMFVNGLHNLIENAVLHGGKTSRITISATTKGKNMILRLSDDGQGIPDEDKSRIFNWSYKNRSGHGLHFIREALAITDIEIHEVGVHGEGAVFELTMPKGRFRSRPHREPRSREQRE